MPDLCLSALLACVAGCATERPAGVKEATFPLPQCQSPEQKHCIARLFVSDQEIESRDLHRFPKRYLELWDESVRAEECARLTQGSRTESFGDCQRRLAALSDYFNPAGQRPDDRVIGVALEGGGGKSAPFALGVLAGLHQLGLFSDRRVGAVASVSGGTYAASFLFNRLLDQHQQRPGAGDFDQWFRSCVPDAYGHSPHLGSLAEQGLPLCGELSRTQYTYNRFRDDYAFQGQVWQFPKVLFPDASNGLEEGRTAASVANTGALLGQTGFSLPFQYVARGIFRWPYNSAPSKLAYMYGLERQYGYSPQDWLRAACTSRDQTQAIMPRDERALAACTPADKTRATLTNRQTRSLAAVADASKSRGGPQWIIASNTPGSVSPIGWLTVFSRDPVRHQFELTPEGYGSGIHGYARIAPESPPRFLDSLGPAPQQMSILDAVAASSAFFDDEQSLYNQLPTRVAFAATQGLLNITWFTEIRNFNAAPSDRAAQSALPWPLWATKATRFQTSPYIHLQDGGNSENTGILPLLRRGYKTIVYSHSTADRKAQFDDICHLKNQLELDAAYFMRSPDLDAMVAPISPSPESDSPPRYVSYLDQMCSEQIDASDRAAFDDNSARKGNSRTQALAKLYCGRLGYPVGAGDRTDYDPRYTPCSEYVQKFPSAEATPHAPQNPPARTFAPVPALFFERSSGPLKFLVYRGDALAYRHRPPSDAELISTIVAIVPAVTFQDFRAQVQRNASRSGVELTSWADYCRRSSDERKALAVASCFGPDARLFAASADSALSISSNPAIPCTAMAHILAHGCASDHMPSFPQDGVVSATWSSSYTEFASYFDLGRHQVWRACAEFGGCSQTSLAVSGAPGG